MLAHRRVVSQQLVAAQHQLTEIDHAFALALLFIERINFGFFAAFLVVHSYVFGALAVFFAGSDEPHQLLGWKAFVVHIELLAQALDGRQLVLRVENLKALRQVGHLVMRTQEAVTQAMESAYPHAAHVHRQHAGQAQHHLFGGLVGKRHGQHAARRDLAGLQQPGDACGQHPRLAGACASQDQRMRVWQHDRGQLLGIEVLKKWGAGGDVGEHRCIVESPWRRTWQPCGTWLYGTASLRA